MDFLSGKTEIILDKIAEYAKPALTGETSYLTQNSDDTVFTVTDVFSIDG